MSTIAISKPVFQEIDGTVILPPTFIKEWAFPADNIKTLFILSVIQLSGVQPCTVSYDCEIIYECPIDNMLSQLLGISKF